LRTAGTLVVVGDGPTRAELQRRYPAVKWLGYKTGTELAKCYATADVFVFPSKTDTFGVVMLESMACGTPVAAYPVTGPVDVVEQNITGILHEDLQIAMEQALLLDRNIVHQASTRWTWQSCTETFVQNLITISH
jgi:glycosyltransferase involved in cell wall biosynthesis